MGLISFVKNVGEKIFGGNEAQAATADELKKELDKHGLNAEGLDIAVDGDKVVVKGKTNDSATAEKIAIALGNTIGVAEVDNQLEADNAEDESNFYTVVSGDTLSKIAKEQYGNANDYMKIFEANKPMLSHPDKIYPGQVLRIPK
ncbi:LysM domain/BON superfamily protein [Oligella ureolytica]|uniref:Potassium binding protein Kbp n=1 Tax=Oligella ureolytica TaxID=90244 RepID=A0A378XG93_9BURK|nr:peptidoglycan-binding protein LysM [Oligella ureolytica]NLP32527.1 peptidoglycan-binding protein LysM [Oligella ureolytica]QPT41017.1 peptidoglycan-binding protein LysM [Oligella ureolytica]SUA53453.1 LysM domain/BON superfamily protein [Oligella ureolytica]SUA53518.1 LysM domain/BON superfamily protein [Oligella ureolytica]